MEKYYKKLFIPLTVIAAALFVFIVFIPFVIGVIYSFSAWKGTYFEGGSNPFQAFVGLKNYVNAFKNIEFTNALAYSAKYTILAVVVINFVSLAMALLISGISKGAGIFRTIFFMPNMMGGLVLGYIWLFIYEIVFSNLLFGPKGMIPVAFLTNMTQNSTKALFAMVILCTWQTAGYMMIIYFAGLNNIPPELYESSKIDGANAWQRFRYVTMPLLMPSVTIVLFLLLANSFKLLDQNIALTDGNFNTRMLATQILKITQESSPPDYGQAQAQAVIFFIIVAIVGLVQVMITKKREVEM